MLPPLHGMHVAGPLGMPASRHPASCSPHLHHLPPCLPTAASPTPMPRSPTTGTRTRPCEQLFLCWDAGLLIAVQRIWRLSTLLVQLLQLAQCGRAWVTISREPLTRPGWQQGICNSLCMRWGCTPSCTHRCLLPAPLAGRSPMRMPRSPRAGWTMSPLRLMTPVGYVHLIHLCSLAPAGSAGSAGWCAPEPPLQPRTN